MIKFIKADERSSAKKAKVTMCIFGPAGAGKTTQIRTLDPKKTLFLDLEAGTLAVDGWTEDNVFDVIKIAAEIGAHPWELARMAALYIGGPDPSDESGPYSRSVHQGACEFFGDPSTIAHFDTVFVDSITVASRQCLKWAKTQPEAFSEKTGKPDIRGAYGLLGREMIQWITHLQHSPRNVIMVGILDRVVDELKRVTWEPQIEGGKTSRELPGIFDEVLTLSPDFTLDDGTPYRAFVCHQQNPWGYPAKDRSGCLEMIEEPNLAKVIEKIRAGKRIDNIQTTIPTQP